MDARTVLEQTIAILLVFGRAINGIFRGDAKSTKSTTKRGQATFLLNCAAGHEGATCLQVQTSRPFPFATPIDRTAAVDLSTLV